MISGEVSRDVILRPVLGISTACDSERLSAKAPLATARGTDWSPQVTLNKFVNRVIKLFIFTRDALWRRAICPPVAIRHVITRPRARVS